MVAAAEALLDFLEGWGVEYFFGCPGTTEAAILDASVDRKKPKFILCTHEITAISAADGYARITGRPGVALFHANVGIGNAVSGIHSARMANVPVVAINCIKPRSILSHGAFTTAHDHQEMVKQYTKWDWQVLKAETLVEDLERAFRLSMAPPMGPTYLAIPEDILTENVDISKNAGPFEDRLSSRPSSVDIERASEILADARFPLILAGSGVAQEEAMEQVVELAGILSAPVCCENRLHMDYNPYPTEEPHFVGPFQPGADYVEHSDVFLAIGCKLFVEFIPPAVPWISPETKLIHMNPDPSDIGNLYRPEVGLCGSVKSGIEDLLESLALKLGNKEQILQNRNREVQHLHNDFISRRNEAFEAIQSSSTLKVASLAKELADMVDSQWTIVVDAATSNDVLVEYVPRFNTKSYYAVGTGGNLGWGMGAALGIKLASPERKVVCVVGDGVFMFGMPALHMAAKNRVPVTFIVINNSSYAAVKSGLLRFEGRAAKQGIFPGSDISGPDYKTIAKGFGLPAFKVTSNADWHYLSQAVEQDEEPVLIEMVTDPSDVGRLPR